MQTARVCAVVAAHPRFAEDAGAELGVAQTRSMPDATSKGPLPSRHDRQQAPFSGDALQRVLAAVDEPEPGAGDEVSYG